MSNIKFYSTPQYETIFFGEYIIPNAGKPNDIFAKYPIEWLVLEKNLSDRTALLLSKYIIDWEAIDSLFIESWKNSYLRKWLNSEFYKKSFSPEEKQMIIPTHTEGTVGNNNYTVDNVFLLSEEEVKKYFSLDEAIARLPMILSLDDSGASESNPILINCEPMDWWTRTLGSYEGCAVSVDRHGDLVEAYANLDEYGVRPAMRIQW
jgi:hypothetical protein